MEKGITVIAGVNLNNLKANHNSKNGRGWRCWTVIAGVNLNNLKANHNQNRLTPFSALLLSLA